MHELKNMLDSKGLLAILNELANLCNDAGDNMMAEFHDKDSKKYWDIRAKKIRTLIQNLAFEN